jgi:molybdate transport system permease protein
MLTPEEWSIIALSLKVSLVATAATLPVAYLLAWTLARLRFPGKTLLDAFVHLPLVVPPVVTGWLLLVLFGRSGPIGAWLERSFGPSSCSVDRRGARRRGHGAAFDGAGDQIVDRGGRPGFGAARPGASRLRAPSSRIHAAERPRHPARATRLACSIGEFGATITFVSNIPGETRTLPLAIYAAPSGAGPRDHCRPSPSSRSCFARRADRLGDIGTAVGRRTGRRVL